MSLAQDLIKILKPVTINQFAIIGDMVATACEPKETMTPDELKKMLGLKPTASAKATKETLTIQSWEDEPIRDSFTWGMGPSVFNIDEWELEQGWRLGSRSGPHRTPFLHGLSSGDAGMFLGDCLAAAYRRQPQPVCLTPDKQFDQFMKELIESPDFKVLHHSTRGNLLASQMAAMEFANQYSQLVRKLEVDEAVRSTGAKGKDAKGDKDAGTIACLTAVNAALKAATKEVDQLEDVQRGLGGNGADASTMTLERMQQIFHKVKSSSVLRRICELAGRYRMAAQAQQRQKTIHGYDEMVGVELSGDLSRLLPSELAQLADEDMELDAMRRLVERQSMSREYRGVEKQAKGPIVVVVDESGSMSGEPVAQAKAFALAMYWIAKHQKRWCCLVGFAGGTEGTYCVLPPDKNMQERLMGWLEHFYGGGTHCDVPLVELPSKWDALGCPKGKTDMVVITDAQVNVPLHIVESFKQFKVQEKVKLSTIVIGSEAGDMKDVSDKVFHVPGVDVSSAAVTDCFAV
jgi:uncharacterized protein with von Willebrand factor type A (vWA) domain